MVMDNFENPKNTIGQNDPIKENNIQIKSPNNGEQTCCGPNSMCQKNFNQINIDYTKMASTIGKLEEQVIKLENELKDKEKKINDNIKQSATMLYELDDKIKKKIQNKLSIEINATHIKNNERDINKDIGLYKKTPKGIKRIGNQCYLITVCNLLNGFDGIHSAIECQVNIDIKEDKKDNESLLIQELNNILNKLNDPKIKSEDINVNELEDKLCKTAPVTDNTKEFIKGVQSCPFSLLNHLLDVVRDKCKDKSTFKEVEPAYSFLREKIQGVFTAEKKCLGKFCTNSEDLEFNSQPNFNLIKSPGNNYWNIQQENYFENKLVNDYNCTNCNDNKSKQGITREFQKIILGILILQTELYKWESDNKSL